MDITLTPDESLPENTLHVARNLDDELFSAMQASDFEIVIDDQLDRSNIRIAPALCEQIMQWMMLRRVSEHLE